MACSRLTVIGSNMNFNGSTERCKQFRGFLRRETHIAETLLVREFTHDQSSISQSRAPRLLRANRMR